MKNLKSLIKRILILGFAIYVFYTLYSQQLSLNAYQSDADRYRDQIKEAESTHEDLNTIKENINSDEYIENIARRKLGMYLPNERVYIDITK